MTQSPNIQMRSPRLNISSLGTPNGQQNNGAQQGAAKNGAQPIRLKMTASNVGNMVHHGVARKVIEDQNLVYVSKLSPFCRFIKWTVLIYLVMLGITVIFMVVNNYSCGLDANQHTIRMRNVTTPVNSHGFVGETRQQQTFPTYDSLQDTVGYMNFTTKENLQLVNMSAGLEIDEFPL